MAKYIIFKENEKYIQQLRQIAKSENKTVSGLIRELLRKTYPEQQGV